MSSPQFCDCGTSTQFLGGETIEALGKCLPCMRKELFYSLQHVTEMVDQLMDDVTAGELWDLREAHFLVRLKEVLDDY